jgi:type IV secretory pathway VirB2 component (pilin)
MILLIVDQHSVIRQTQDILTGPIAKGLSLVAVVVGALMFTYRRGRREKIWAGILFLFGASVLVANLLMWIFRW